MNLDAARLLGRYPKQLKTVLHFISLEMKWSIVWKQELICAENKRDIARSLQEGTLSTEDINTSLCRHSNKNVWAWLSLPHHVF